MINENVKLTVFTPTYNREKLLVRLYESLKRQTIKDFVWLIVDDCSTDNTKELIKGFISEQENNADRDGGFRIEYIKREKNGGKMRAHNDGVAATKTPYFLCLDSDDYLVDTAVCDLLLKAKEVEDINSKVDTTKKIAGIISHKGKSESELLSDVNFPENVDRSTLYGLYLKGFRGETTIMFLTDVIAKFPFPEIEGEKYVPEDYIYDKIDRSYEYIVFDKIITVCEIVSEGYTDSVVKLKNNNPNAFYLLYEQRAIITPMSILKIKYSGFYVKYAKKCKKPVFKTKLPKLFVLVGLLASVFINE